MQALDADTAILVETVRAALEWCRATVERLYREGMELRARRRREEAAERFRSVRIVAWAATELVYWLCPWDQEAQALREAVQRVRRMTPRMYTREPRVVVDLAGLLPVLPYEPRERDDDPPAYDQWDALCNYAGLTDAEAEAVLLVSGMGYSFVEAARLIGCKPSRVEWHWAGGWHKIRRLLDEQGVVS